MKTCKKVWYYNGIKVSKRWLEFNYGAAHVREFEGQADNLYRMYNGVSPNNVLSFGNGVSVKVESSS